MAQQYVLVDVDLRILEETYKTHVLIARYYNGRYTGQIWKNREKIADYEGANLDVIFQNLRVLVDVLIEKHN